jgi:hypothetical protein
MAFSERFGRREAAILPHRRDNHKLELMQLNNDGASRWRARSRAASEDALPKYRKQPHAKVQTAGMEASKAS